MASLLQKLLKRPPPTPPLRVLASFANPQLANPPLRPSLLHDPLPGTNPRPYPSSFPSLTDSFHQSLQFYPSFPHCFHWTPISQSGFDRCDDESDSDPGVGEEGRDRMVWADSVKKKRKRKMNKHKYKKLRKRLRRQKS
ncbi:hypothetical protein COCNU_scaffold012684G000020 [Cocos nucifera]|nr:hypothetical protein [Cocos nucifera]